MEGGYLGTQPIPSSIHQSCHMSFSSHSTAWLTLYTNEVRDIALLLAPVVGQEQLNQSCFNDRADRNPPTSMFDTLPYQDQVDIGLPNVEDVNIQRSFTH